MRSSLPDQIYFSPDFSEFHLKKSYFVKFTSEKNCTEKLTYPFVMIQLKFYGIDIGFKSKHL